MRTERPARSRLVAAAAVLLITGSGGLVAGCSQTDEISEQLTRAQYVLEMKALVKRVQAESRLAANLLSVDSLAEAAPLIDEVVEQFDEIVSRLEEIEPPQEIAALHNALTGALSSAAELLTDAKQAVESDDIASLILLAPQLADFRDRFREIVGDYEAEGYDLSAAVEPVPQAP